MVLLPRLKLTFGPVLGGPRSEDRGGPVTGVLATEIKREKIRSQKKAVPSAGWSPHRGGPQPGFHCMNSEENDTVFQDFQEMLFEIKSDIAKLATKDDIHILNGENENVTLDQNLTPWSTLCLILVMKMIN